MHKCGVNVQGFIYIGKEKGNFITQGGKMFKRSFATVMLAILGLMAINVFFAGASFASWEDDLEVNPRINVVHLTDTDINTQYYFLAAVPMAIFHYNGKVYSSLIVPDVLSDSTVAHIVDDWKVYLNQHSGEKRHANFIGGVSSSVQDAIKSKFGITDDQDVNIIEGTPIEVANQIAEKDWKHSDYVVIAPYVSSPSDHTIESISNAAAIAAVLNAPLLFAYPDSLSQGTLTSIAKVGATSAILVEIDDVLSDNVNTQLTNSGVGIPDDLTTEGQIVTKMRGLSGHSTLCGIVNNWQNLPAALAGARYGGYVLYLPSGLNKLANSLHRRIMADPELQSFYKLAKPVVRRAWIKLSEDEIAQNFYNWLTPLGGDDPDTLETVVTFEPQGTGGGDLETTFDRAITGDFSDLTRKGAITGRMPLAWLKNIALLNRTSMYRATIFANPRPTHITLAMNAYEVQHLVDEAGGNTPPDSWGLNHITNEMFGWPYRGWCADNGYFPWDDIHSNAPDLSPIFPPGPGDGADHDPGQFASFLSGGYETHFHSGSEAGTGSHLAQPDVSNIGFVQDAEDGSAFLYFSCHGGGTSIAVKNTDNGIAQDGTGEAWGDPYWPDDDGRTYDGSAGGSYSQTDLDNDLTNAHGMMVAYNACGMANGYMNEIVLEHGGTVSIGSYTSVSFCGSGWWWNLWVHLVTHEGYTAGEAAAYATAREAPLHTPASKGVDNTLYYVVYGDPYTPFAQTDWTSPDPAPINVNYGGHKPDKPANELAGSVVPDTIQVNVPTQVAVTLLDSLGGGIDSVLVTISGWGYSAVDTTDTLGQAIFNITAPYGELLLVTGEKESFDTYLDTIYVVGASDFLSAEISASVASIGLTDTLAPYYEGVITGECSESGFTLLAKGCEVDTSTVTSGDSVDLAVTPYTTGSIQGVIAKSGFNLYLENIPVINVYGTLSGVVIDSATSDSLANVLVRGFTHGADTSLVNPIFEELTDSNGVYSVGFDLTVGEYDLYVQQFGYLPFAGTAMVMYGATTFDIALSPAPSGTVSGTVYEETTMKPLTATIKIFRSDNMELYTIVYTDSLAGGTYTVDLPYFTYNFKVTSYYHIPLSRDVTVDLPSQTQDFKMATSMGNILVINDDDGSKGGRKVLKDGRVIEAGEDKNKVGEAADDIFRYLSDLGYYVVQEEAGSTDPNNWPNYDILVWSDGDDTQPVADEGYRTALGEWVENGGKLLIEGGEVGYDAASYPGYPDFAQYVLHVSGWSGDESGNLVLTNTTHPLATTPNQLPNSIGISYNSTGDQDAMQPASDAYNVYECKNKPGNAGILVYDDTPSPQSAQVIFYCFDFTALSDTMVAKELVENTASYLLSPEPPPTGGISGTVDLLGAEDDSGAVITASCGGFSRSDTTGYGGDYLIGSLYPGYYQVKAHKDDYQDSTLTQILVGGGQITQDVDLGLYPVVVIFSTDFDANNGGFTAQGEDWEWGLPTSGPGSAHSGAKVWATKFAGDYSSSSDSKLESPSIGLSGISEAKLEFWHWYSFEGSATHYDGGNVKISVDGGPFEVITPEEGYDGTIYSTNAGIPNEEGFASPSAGNFWHKEEFNLTSYVDHEVVIRFHFGSDGSVTYPGWYVDDFKVYYVNHEVGLRRHTAQGQLPEEYSLSQNYPNPFNPTTLIRYALPAVSNQLSAVTLEVYNILGQKVATLVDQEQKPGYYDIGWDASSLSSGIYFYRLNAGEFSQTRKMLLLR